MEQSTSVYDLGRMPGSDIFLYQETLYRSVSYKKKIKEDRSLRDSRDVQHINDATGFPPSPAGPPACSPMHLIYHRSLSFILEMSNRSCILKFASAKLRRRKPKVLVALHIISEICLPKSVCDSLYRYFAG